MVEESKEISSEEMDELVKTKEGQEIIKNNVRENRIALRKSIEDVLSGKCPMKFLEKDGKIYLDFDVIREGFGSKIDVFKHLTATTDIELANDIIIKGAYGLTGKSDAEKYNIALQNLADSEPKDATESRLILQAHALYSQGMKRLHQAEINDMIPQIDFCLKSATKLLRLHNETIEALNKYRRGGEQRVIVQHVQVNDGGRAIVGNMIAGGGVK